MKIQAVIGRAFQYDKNSSLHTRCGKITLIVSDSDPDQKQFEGELLSRIYKQLLHDQDRLMTFLREEQINNENI